MSNFFEKSSKLAARKDWFGDWDAAHGPARQSPSKPSPLVLWSPNWKTESLTLSAISGDIEDNLSEWSNSLAKSGSERLFVLPPTTKDLLHRPQLAELDEENVRSSSTLSHHPADPGSSEASYPIVKKLNKQLIPSRNCHRSTAKSISSQVTKTTLEPIVESRGTPDSVSVSEATQQTTIIENHPTLLGTVQTTLADKVVKNKFEENLNKCIEAGLKKSASTSTLASYKRRDNQKETAKETVKSNSASPQLIKRQIGETKESDESSTKTSKKELKRQNSLVRQLSKMLHRILPQRHKNVDVNVMDEKRVKHQIKTNSLPSTPLSNRKPPKKIDSNGSHKIRNGVGSNSVPATPNSQRRQPQTYYNTSSNRAVTATVAPSPPHALPPAYNPNRSTPQPIPMNIVGAETLSGHISDSGISRHSEYAQRQPSPLTVNGRSNGYHSDYGALPGKRTPIFGKDNGHLSDDMSKEYVPPRPPRQQYGSYAQNSASERAQQIINTVNANPKNRANAILQQLRSDDGALSESDMSTNEFPYQRLPIPPQRNSSSNVLNPKGVVYLEFNKEVKRSALPMKIYSLEQIKSLFLRSFPSLNLQFLNQEHVKIYISDRNSTGDNVLFYELEDLNDIRDQCVLKIHQNQAMRSGPTPVRFTDALPTDYISEPEMMDDRSGRYASYRGPNRPSSVVPSDQARYPIYGSIQNGGRKSSNMLSSSHYEPYYDPYYSDSSQGPRSGSATPVIDKETRYRVENMEKQLSDLSNMVRHALHKDQSEDMVDIGRRLMEMRSDATRLAKCNRKVEDSPPFNSSNLKAIQRNAASLQSGLAELKESLRMDALARSDILRDTFSRLNHRIALFAAQKERELADFKAQGETSQTDSVLEGQKDEHIRSVAQLEDTIQHLEDRIEERRVSVLSKNQKLRMNEVEELAAQVNGLDQQTDSLKAEFQNLEEDVNRHLNKYRDEIAKDMEFLRREPINLENFQRRCAALQNMLQTMRKLALVQDPAMYDRNKAALNGGPKFSASNGNGNNGHNRQDLPPLPNPNRIPSPKPSRLTIPPPPPPPSTSMPQVPQSPSQNNNPPKPAPPPPSITSSANSANVLDSILDELNHTANSLPNMNQTIANGQVESSPPKSPVKSPQKKQQFRIAENNGGTGGNKQNGMPEKASAVDQRRRVDNVGSRIQTRPIVPTSVQRTIILPKNT